jgi:hypothetical protein
MSVVALLYYLCGAPAPGTQALSCVARQLEATSCAEAVAMVEAGLATDRLWFAAACVVTTPRPRAAR